MLCALLFLAFIAVVVVDAWAFYAVLFGESSGIRLRFAYLITFGICLVVGYWTSFRYEYFKNENTRFCGWPVPIVVFQRENPDAHWDDFVGPTTGLGYPMNVAIFMALPSVIFLRIVFWRGWRQSRRGVDEGRWHGTNA